MLIDGGTEHGGRSRILRTVVACHPASLTSLPLLSLTTLRDVGTPESLSHLAIMFSDSWARNLVTISCTIGA